MSLEFQNVSYHYPGTRQGLNDLSMAVNSGELVAVIGPSGSGKSTLLKLVSGLTTGHSGTIKLCGDDLANKPVHLRNIGMVFQNYALFPHLNVLDNISYGLKLRKVAKDQRYVILGRIKQMYPILSKNIAEVLPPIILFTLLAKQMGDTGPDYDAADNWAKNLPPPK